MSARAQSSSVQSLTRQSVFGSLSANGGHPSPKDADASIDISRVIYRNIAWDVILFVDVYEVVEG